MSRDAKTSNIEWIGQIPKTWNTNKVKYVTKCMDGKRVPVDASQRTPGPYPYWGAGSITDHVDKFLFDEELVLLGEDGAPFFDKTRNVAFLINEKVWINNHIHVLKPQKNIDASFLCYALNSVDYREYINGAIINKLTQSDMKTINIPYPPLPEQRQIVSFLDRKCSAINTAIEKTKKSIEKLEEYKKAVITKAVTKGLNPDVKMKDSGVEWIGEIPEDWDIRRIKTVGTYRNGLTYSPDDLTDETNGTLVLRSSNIKDGKLVLQDNLYVRTHISDKLRVQKGDILICSRNGSRALIGKNALIDSDMDASFGAFMMIYRSKDPYYIHWVLKSEMMSYYLASFTTSTINQLIGSDFGNMYLPWPLNIQERQQISNYLNNKCSSIDALVTRKQETINKLEEYKKSLIYYAVTGKIDCRSEVV